jgi:hypothetical protein
MTRWAKSYGDGNRSGGEAIQSLTPDEAKDWLEYQGETEALEQYFVESIEDA